MKKFYAITLGLTAIVLAITAAYFSVFGLSKLFVGAATSVIFMAGALEFSKIVVVTLLHQYWKQLAKGLKTYLLIGVVILMIITSLGIYGYLTSAYSIVSTDLNKTVGSVELLDKRIQIKKEEKTRLDGQLNAKTERIKSLSDLRKTQESRLDSLYKKGLIASAKQTEKTISQADDNIAKLNEEIGSISTKIEVLNDSVSGYENGKFGLANGGVSGEVGPLKYISKLTGAGMDIVVNWLTLLLIIVFDPMTIALVIATSSMVKLIKKDKEGVLEKNTPNNFNQTKDAVVDFPESIGKGVENCAEIVEHNSAIKESQIPDEPSIEQKNAAEEVCEEPVSEQQAIINERYEDERLFALKSEASDKKSIYLRLLEIFYEGGKRKKGDGVPNYIDFKKSVFEILPDITEKEIKDFLVVCNLFKITEFKNFEKEYSDAFYLVSKV